MIAKAKYGLSPVFVRFPLQIGVLAFLHGSHKRSQPHFHPGVIGGSIVSPKVKDYLGIAHLHINKAFLLPPGAL